MSKKKDLGGSVSRDSFSEEQVARRETLRPLTNNDLADLVERAASGLRCTREQVGFVRTSRILIRDYYAEKGSFKGFQSKGTGISRRVLAILEALLQGHDAEVPALVAEIAHVERERGEKESARLKREWAEQRAARGTEAERAERMIRFMRVPQRPHRIADDDTNPSFENAIRIIEGD